VTQGHTSNNGASGSASANWQATYGTLGWAITTRAISTISTGSFPAASWATKMA
jgi:hypothetical protein